MRLLTRFAGLWRATRAYEWAESCDLLLERGLGRNRTWSTPFAPPVRVDLMPFDQCFDAAKAREALELLARYRDELKRLPPALSLNGFFGPADVAFYWSFIRARQPDMIVEVGSGYSSRVALRALEKNQHGRLICIDPAPRLHLPQQNLTHIAARLEEVDATLFASFKPHDILFIDSSHTGLEVREHAQILDGLPVGALVHYHDIDYPWERQQPDWDEDAVLASYLTARPHWNVVVSGSLMSRDYLTELRAAIPAYQHTPYRRHNGLWMIRAA